jgi:hypothetical protein
MIDGFHPDDDRHPLRIVLVNMLDKFGLGVGRPCYENRTSIRNRIHDCLKIVVIFCGMSASDGVGLMMDVSRRMIRMQHESFDVRRVEMENAGFVMIDPDDSMLVMVVHDIGTFLGPAALCSRESRFAQQSCFSLALGRLRVLFVLLRLYYEPGCWLHPDKVVMHGLDAFDVLRDDDERLTLPINGDGTM